MACVGYVARRPSRFCGLALALAALFGGVVAGAGASGRSDEEYRRPEQVTVALPGEGEIAYARIVLRRLPFGTTLRKPALPTVTVADRELLPAAVTVFARVAPHGQRGEVVPEFVVDVAVLRLARSVAGTPTGPSQPARSLRLTITPDRDELGVLTQETESAALRRRGSFHGPEPYDFCGPDPRGEPRRIAGPALERFAPATAFKWAYAAACDESIPGDVAARIGGVAAWGTWSLSASDPKGIEFTIRANRAITGFGIVVPEGSLTRYVPPAGFTCPHAGIDFLECEGALAAGAQSGEGRIGLTPLPRKTAMGSVFVTTPRAAYGPYRLRYAG